MQNMHSSALIGQGAVTPVVKVKYVLYARKSTEQDEKQALSIESQVKEMLTIAEREGLEVVDIRREAHSAKDSGQRPVFRDLLEDIRRDRYNGILTWAPDRLSRNAGDLGSVVDLMDQKHLIEIRTYGQHFHNSPNEKFLLMILCSQAKLENDNKSINVKRGLKTRVEMGLWPCPAPTGYMKEKRSDRKCETLIDPERAPVVKKIFEKVAYEKWSGRKIHNWLKHDLNFRTASGKKHLSLGNVYALLENTFYYGTFEYPQKSGNWYQGKHDPLITKELYDAVQEQVKRQFVRSETKEFAFTKLMTCGLCGSGITADEKFKKQLNGNVHRYVYYKCTMARDGNCKNKFINEVELVRQFEQLIDTISVDEMKVRGRIKEEMERFQKFQHILKGVKQKIEKENINVRKYMHFILKHGSDLEKREALSTISGKIILADRYIKVAN